MDQESEYLQALETVATYEINGERLQMRTAEGSLAADYVSAVTGVLTYNEDVTLPDDALFQVQVQDVSLADAPAIILGQQVLPTNGQQVPLPFEVTFNWADIDPRHTYAISARITDADGNLLFINTSAYNIITRDNPIFSVEVVLESIP